MTAEEYISERLDDQISWYSTKGAQNQKRYKWLRIIEIISAALIPFIAGMGDKVSFGNWIVGILGMIVAVTAGLITLHKNHELWIQYRTTCENLKHEKYLYITSTNPYNNDTSFNELVSRVEGLISKENSTWRQIGREKQNKVEKVDVLDA